MDDDRLKTSYGKGLELDTIELPTPPLSSSGHKSRSDTEPKSTFSLETASHGQRHLRLTFTAVITTLALLAALAIYLKKQSLEVSFLSLEKKAASDSYLRVGPISATLKNNEVIRLSLDIGCENDAAKKRLAEKDSRIRDKIVSVITAPDTITLLEKHQYDAVRSKIKEGLEKLYGEPVGEIFFAELITY